MVGQQLLKAPQHMSYLHAVNELLTKLSQVTYVISI